MQITLSKIKVRELVLGYKDDGESGVRALNNTLDVRPPYQREFVYKDKQRAAVIETLLKGFPLNVMYHAVREDGTFEILDGQQRTISICQYVTGEFSFEERNFGNQPADIRERILDYELMVYLCEGAPSEKLDWFRIINIAGEKLTEQELRNAVYHGPWLAEAKKWFSKTGGPAATISQDYVAGKAIRQEVLETALKWICIRDKYDQVETYMDVHSRDSDANDIWSYFQEIITWVETTFPVKRKQMKNVDWGSLYHFAKDLRFDDELLEQKIKTLMIDDEVTNKSGIYAYVLDGKEHHLNIRTFSDKQKTEAFERQLGKCAQPNLSGHDDNLSFSLNEMEGDHIVPWSLGGATSSANCQMLCIDCNRRKGAL